MNEWEYLLVEMDSIEEEWLGFGFAASSVTLELVSPSLNLSRTTGPYVSRTRSAIALYVTNLNPRHRNWFVISLVASTTIDFAASYLVTNKGSIDNTYM